MQDVDINHVVLNWAGLLADLVILPLIHDQIEEKSGFLILNCETEGELSQLCVSFCDTTLVY